MLSNNSNVAVTTPWQPTLLSILSQENFRKCILHISSSILFDFVYFNKSNSFLEALHPNLNSVINDAEEWSSQEETNISSTHCYQTDKVECVKLLRNLKIKFFYCFFFLLYKLQTSMRDGSFISSLGLSIVPL